MQTVPLVPCLSFVVISADPAARRQARVLLRGIELEQQHREFGDAATALDCGGASVRTDLIVLDLDGAGGFGLAELARLRMRLPKVPVVVVSAVEDRRRVEQAIACGASGYLPTGSPARVLESAIALVLAGGVYIPPFVVGRSEVRPVQVRPPVPAAPPPRPGAPRTDDLTHRQREVLNLLGAGKPNKLIARELDVSAGTVKSHLRAIFRALGVKNRTAAVIAAQRPGPVAG